MMRFWSFGNRGLIVGVLLLVPQLVCGETFKIGSISDSPVAETRKFWPFAAYLARQLQSEGIDQGKVVVADSLSGMSSFLQTRQADLYIDSFFPSLAVSRLCGSKLLLRRWKTRKGVHRSVIFTNKDSNIGRLEDLRGKVIAFESPFSSSGYFFPKIVLLERGLRLVFKRLETDSVKPDEVGYVFTHTDSKTILLVLNRVVAAGATEEEKYFTTARNLDSFKLLHETNPFPRHMVSHRADLPAKMVAKVKDILLNMHHTDEGNQVLQAFESTTRFEEIPTRDIALAAGVMKHIDTEIKHQLQR